MTTYRIDARLNNKWVPWATFDSEIAAWDVFSVVNHDVFRLVKIVSEETILREPGA